ncbi:MAG: DCC1-like thiol-disulfide oxidoreductase family protein [Melioribacteraceae bacterium]|nr:DCC1-like thiol-disulfide oxidoreductase family protein [Melioribacteraceae bacterium]
MFDGICLLCNQAVYFLHKKLRYRDYKFIPSQSDEGIELLKEYSLEQISQESLVLIKDNSILIKSDALLNIIDDMPRIWHILKLFKLVPKYIRDFIYSFVSRKRHLLSRK